MSPATKTGGDAEIIREAMARSQSISVEDLPRHDFNNIRRLDLLRGADISDISTLQGLTSLKRLNLESTQVSDLSPLQNLTSLMRLDLERTQVSDLSPLRGLTHLERLDLGGAQVSDLSPLRVSPA